MIEACVANLGKYNEGELSCEYLKMPTTKEDLQEVLKQIGVDGKKYEECFITEYETDISGLKDVLGEYDNIDELNYLAVVLDKLDDNEIAVFEAALEYSDSIEGVKDLINLAQNTDCYDFIKDIKSERDLGYYYIHDIEKFGEISNSLEAYIDYNAIGRDICINESGMFLDSGYIRNNQNKFVEIYNGKEIPEEYKIFVYPEDEHSKGERSEKKPSILKALKQIKQQAKDTDKEEHNQSKSNTTEI